MSAPGCQACRFSAAGFGHNANRNTKLTMKTFRNANFTTRNYECTNVVCCQTDTLERAQAMMPGANWVECSENEITKGRMTQLWKQGAVLFFGWL